MSTPSAVRRWLWTVWVAILLMIAIGGITRLTGSGLSMVDWHPLMGAIPPLGEEDWLAVFERYKQSPQYAQVNHWMALDDFKRIFFWEYLHRLFGRLIGLVFALPFAWFLVRGVLSGPWVRRGLLCLALGGGQGLLGWYMVRSGLVDRPEVSHYRLAAHLSLAFLVGQCVLWFALDAGQTSRPTRPVASRQRLWAWGFVALLALQIVWGAFMAGKRAGLYAPTFPDMLGSYGPAAFFSEEIARDLVSAPLAIHWTHRTLGWLLALLAPGLWWIQRDAGDPSARRRALGVVHLVALQFLLGVATVMLHVPIAIAVAHQVTAFLLLSAAIRLCHHLHASSPDGATSA